MGVPALNRPLVLYARYLGLALALALALLYPWLDTYFVGDDWPVFARNMHFSWDRVPVWFTTLRVGGYRPMHDLFIATCWRWFALNPVGYRLASAFLYALVCANVGILAHLLSEDLRVGLLSTLIFAVFATHAEAVLWLAGTNELPAALFASTSMIAFVLMRKRDSHVWLLLAVVSSLLAFASKETTLAFPLMFFVADLLWGRWFRDRRLDWRLIWPLFVLVLCWAAFLAFRLPMGSAYADYMRPSLFRLAMNLVYYALIGLFLLPNNFAFWETRHSWSVLPFAILGISLIVIAACAWMWIRGRLWLVNRQRTRTLLFSAAWAVVVLGPTIFIVSERTSFGSSIGIAIAFAALLVGMWDEARRHGVWARRIVTAITIAYLVVSGFVFEYRCAWYGRSGDISEAVLDQLADYARDLSPEATVVLVGLPDHTGYAYTFRNTFPSARAVLDYAFDVLVVLDVELRQVPPEDAEMYVRQISDKPGAVVYWYHRDGDLVPAQD